MKNLKKYNLEDLSEIKIDIYMEETSTYNESNTMIIKYSGEYGLGSSGDSDAIYMCAMGKAALSAWNPSGVIIDLSDLSYKWGDMIEMVFDIGSEQYIDSEFPRAVIVGSKCEEAIRTLIFGLNSEESIESVGWIFRNLESGWKYIESKI